MIIFKRGPTINNRKPLLELNSAQKENILKDIRKGWKDLLRLHFNAEGGISDNRIEKWKPLSSRHKAFKVKASLEQGTLEMTSPNLLVRYQRAIKLNGREFSITMVFPTLISGARSGGIVDAGVHQFGAPARLSRLGNDNPLPRRRIIKKDFVTLGRNKTIEYLQKRG